MSRNLVLLLAGLIFTLPARALDRSKPVIEARICFDNVHRLDRLGDLAGELDVCTWEEDETGGWLLINTDAEQLARIRSLGLHAEVTWPDVREKFRHITGVDPYDIDAGRNFGYFFTYWEMQDTLDRLVANYPNLCTKFSAGSSFQGRALWCLKISDNPEQPEDEPACFFNGATHAREPMGTHGCIAFADHILRSYGTDSVATWLVNNREIYIIPVMNPDGYVYNSDSGGSSSNWRKNRRGPVPPNIGIDLNRNYGYKWGYDNQGSSSNASSETYRGPERFSEPETQVARDFMALNKFRTCMDFHTYGRYNMYPWGYASSQPPEQPVLREAVDTFRMYNNYPASRTGQVNTTIYACNGLSVDWEYSDTTGKFVTYAYTIEMDSVDFWHGWNDSNAVRIECVRNRPVLYYLARIAGVYFDPASLTIDDSAGGNGNGRLDPGETADIWFMVKNRATHPIDSAYSISGLLRSGYAEVTVPDSVEPFPNIARRTGGGNNASPFSLQASSSAQPGTAVPLRLELSYTDAGHTYMQPVNFQIVIGGSSSIAEPAWQLAVEATCVLPNPARHRVQFSIPRIGEPSQLDVIAADGSRLLSTPIDGSFTWNCSAMPAGVYFAKVTAGSAVAVRRFTVVH